MAIPRSIPYRAVLLALLALLFAWSCVGPHNPRDFLLEHTFTAAVILALILIDRLRPLSNISYTLIFLFLLLHVLGAHYTYSFVPYDRWLDAIFGFTLAETFNWRRNHYDRLVHFCFGLLLLPPVRECAARWLGVRGLAASLVALSFLAVGSTLYELIEWLFTIVLSPEAAAIYNGQQGDIFDAQKDTALALGGSVASLLIVESTGLGATFVDEAARRRWMVNCPPNPPAPPRPPAHS